MIPTGKLLWVWTTGHLKKVYTTLEAAVDAAVDAGFSGVVVKVANGTYAWLPNTSEGKDIREFITLCRNRGLQVHVWTYSYAISLSGELRACTAAYEAYGDDSFIIDAETEYKKPGAGTFAEQFISGLRAAMPGVEIGYSTYRFPKLHPEFPHSKFNLKCDYAIPQVYFEGSHNVGQQLRQSFEQYMLLPRVLPYIPTGPVYERGAWKPTQQDLDEFDRTAKELRLRSIAWWRWDTAVSIGVWGVIAAHSWPAGPTPEKIHWSKASAPLKDYVLYRTAQLLNLVDAEGYVLVQPPQAVYLPSSIRVRRAIRTLAQEISKLKTNKPVS